jgi:hypothetical protein
MIVAVNKVCGKREGEIFQDKTHAFSILLDVKAVIGFK